MTLKNSKENATIYLINEQHSGDLSDKIEFTSSGNFYEKEGRFYITYKEHRSMGMGDSRVFMKIEPGCVTMRRMGEFQTVMVYKEGKTTEFIYNMPFGRLSMKIKTEKISDGLSADGGELRLSYELFSGGESTLNDIYLRVRLDK